MKPTGYRHRRNTGCFNGCRHRHGGHHRPGRRFHRLHRDHDHGQGQRHGGPDLGSVVYTPASAARFYAAAADATAEDKTDTFTVTAYDNHGDYVSTLVTVDVAPSTAPNRAPVQVAPTTIGTPNPDTGAVDGDLHLTDLDRDGITLTFTPTGGSRSEVGLVIVSDGSYFVDGTTGKWRFVPTDELRHEAALDDGTGPDDYSFHWTATDTRGASVSGDVTVPIVPFNSQS